VSGEPNIELMHKELKVIQCQRLPAVEGKVRIKFLKNCVMGEKHYKINEQEDVEIGKAFVVTATVENKRKNAEVAYTMRIEPHDKRK
jgi:hypothetical protein